MIPKEHDLNNPADLRRLWCDVYDGPVYYAPLTAFEYIAALEKELGPEKVQALLRRVLG